MIFVYTYPVGYSFIEILTDCQIHIFQISQNLHFYKLLYHLHEYMFSPNSYIK